MVNHVVCSCCVVLHLANIFEKLESNPELIVVTYPWNDNVHKFSGVPPYVAMMQELTLLRDEQRSLIDNFVDKVKAALTEYGVNSECLTDENIRQLLDQF